MISTDENQINMVKTLTKKHFLPRNDKEALNVLTKNVSSMQHSWFNKAHNLHNGKIAIDVITSIRDVHFAFGAIQPSGSSRFRFTDMMMIIAIGIIFRL